MTWQELAEQISKMSLILQKESVVVYDVGTEQNRPAELYTQEQAVPKKTMPPILIINGDQ